MNKFIPLSIPNFEGNEKKYVNDALDQGWVSTGGAYITKLEQEMARFLHAENMAAFRYVLEASAPRRPAVWAAWGSIIEQRPYLPRCVEDMITAGEEYGAVWYTAGVRSKKGHPHHPLYLRKDSVLEPFEDLKSYCAML